MYGGVSFSALLLYLISSAAMTLSKDERVFLWPFTATPATLPLKQAFILTLLIQMAPLSSKHLMLDELAGMYDVLYCCINKLLPLDTVKVSAFL